jgi:gluconate 2-dehydrogenase gamma chain
MLLSPFFSDQQIATLRAAFNRLIPTDEFPNACDNGADDYLARQLAGDLLASIELYGAGLDSLNQEAQARHNQDFASLNEVVQDELLACIERGEVQSEWAINPRQFFEAMLNYSAEGYYADAGNGGNREKISWQMIGFLDR